MYYQLLFVVPYFIVRYSIRCYYLYFCIWTPLGSPELLNLQALSCSQHCFHTGTCLCPPFMPTLGLAGTCTSCSATRENESGSDLRILSTRVTSELTSPDVNPKNRNELLGKVACDQRGLASP